MPPLVDQSLVSEITVASESSTEVVAPERCDANAALHAMRKAVNGQVSAELYDKAIGYAARRAKQVERVGGRVDDQYVADLVQSAIADTFEGTLYWDPERCSLEQHVMATIKSRSRHDRARALDGRSVLFDLHEEGRQATALRAEVEALLASELPDEATRELADTCAERLRDLAIQSHDNDVLLLLDCYAEGIIAKDEVIADLGFSAKRYRNARNRLGTYLDHLPVDIRTRGLTLVAASSA